MRRLRHSTVVPRSGRDSTGRSRLSPPAVRCAGLEVELDYEPVLRGVDLEIAAGRVTVLAGASGSGKTTLIKHVLGLLPPDEGTVLIGDQDVWRSNPATLLELRRNLSALHGGSTVYEGSIFASVTIRENLLTRLHEKVTNPSVAAGGSGGQTNNPYVRLYVERLPQVQALPELTEQAEDWLERFDLLEVADLIPCEASAGQRRRAALASALAVDAPLYVLDDPDGALDAHHRKVIVDALSATRARTGATMLIATHDLALARAVADDVAVLSGGRIVFHGDPDAALNSLEQWYRHDVGVSDSTETNPTVPATSRRG